MTTTKPNPYKNFVALTAQVSGVEQKTSKAGKPYAIAVAEVAQLEGQPPITLRVIASNGLGEKLTEGEHTLVGRIGYEEDDKGVSRLLFFPSKIEEPPADGRKRNFANLRAPNPTPPTPRPGASGHACAPSSAWARPKTVPPTSHPCG